MPFFLDGNPTPQEISEAVNYLIANLPQTSSTDVSTGQITAPTGVVSGYLYKYLFVKYADSYDGTVGFSNTPTNKAYYGLCNSNSSTESTSPTDYVWFPVTGGFGTTKFLFYITTGGRQIQFSVATSTPDIGWVQDDGTAIDLDVITGASGPANFVVIRITNDSSPPTDGECIGAIGRTPIAGDMCTLNYNSGISSIVYKYTTGWAVFQKYITGDLIVAQSIVGTNIAGGTITADKIQTNSITTTQINNVATGQIIAGSFNIQIVTSSTTFTVPAYVYKIKITLIGAGGGGGMGSSGTGTLGGFGGSGAGLIKIIAVSPSQVYTVNIGTGGSGATSVGTGGTGGTSSIVLGGSTLMSCSGGLGGQSDSTPGAGGSASGGDLNYSGSYGAGAPFIGVTTRTLTSAAANTGAGGGGGFSGIGNGGNGGSGLCIIEY